MLYDFLGSVLFKVKNYLMPSFGGLFKHCFSSFFLGERSGHTLTLFFVLCRCLCFRSTTPDMIEM
jgi:hypothetical protein